MATQRVDPQRAAQVIALADQFGVAKAAKMAGCSTRTVERYRARLAFDDRLASIVDSKRQELLAKTKHWAEEADEFMSEALETMRTKLAESNLHDVAGAYKIVGEMTLARDALSIDEPSDDSEDSEAEEATDRSASSQESGQKVH